MNLPGLVMLAAANTDLLPIPTSTGSKVPSFHISDMLLVITVAVLLMTGLIVWAVFIRKPKNEHARTRIYKSRAAETETEDGKIRKRKKHKRQRREHRTRNPTLAETGGLPPPKSDHGSTPVH